jgi:hypothetical protein
LSSSWPTIRLGEVVERAMRSETPLSERRSTARKPDTRSFIGPKRGTLSSNKIWARNGSVAVVQEAEAGCYGSGEFPMFKPNADELERRWMTKLSKENSNAPLSSSC